jgi:small subunit ribosomal protein S10
MVTLPTSKRIYCVLRSPHVDKDSREHFEIRTHKRILEIYYDPEVSIVDLLSTMELDSGVFCSISLP